VTGWVGPRMRVDQQNDEDIEEPADENHFHGCDSRELAPVTGCRQVRSQPEVAMEPEKHPAAGVLVRAGKNQHGQEQHRAGFHHQQVRPQVAEGRHCEIVAEELETVFEPADPDQCAAGEAVAGRSQFVAFQSMPDQCEAEQSDQCAGRVTLGTGQRRMHQHSQRVGHWFPERRNEKADQSGPGSFLQT